MPKGESLNHLVSLVFAVVDLHVVVVVVLLHVAVIAAVVVVVL